MNALITGPAGSIGSPVVEFGHPVAYPAAPRPDVVCSAVGEQFR